MKLFANLGTVLRARQKRIVKLPAAIQQACLCEAFEARVLLTITPIVSGNTIAGHIGAGQQDQYTFSAAAGGTIEIAMAATNGSLVPKIDLFDSSLKSIGTSTSSDFGGGTVLTVTAPSSGTYTLIAHDSTGVYTGDYNIAVASAPGVQASDSQGGALLSGQTRAAAINGNLHIYTVQGTAGGNLEIVSAATSGDLVINLDLCGPNGALIKSAHSSDFSGGTVLIASTATNGTYYVIARDVSGSYRGNYNIAAAVVPGAQSPDPSGGPIANGANRTGSLSGNLEVYTLSASAGPVILSMGTTSGDLIPHLSLYGPTGGLIAVANAADFGGGTTLTTSAPAAGLYYVVARDVVGSYRGNYTISATYKPAIGSIAGIVFNDSNGNSKLDTGEAGIAGARVFVDANHNGTLDAGELSSTTSVSGNYTIANVPSGPASLVEIVPTGLLSTTSNPVNVTVSGGSVAAANFGNQKAALISGIVFNDINGNGKKDVGEAAIPGVKIVVDKNRNGIADAGEPSAVTSATGQYSFKTTSSGTTSILQILPPGYLATTANPVQVSTTAGATLFANFGDWKAATIAGNVFNDANGNGKRDAGESGIAGVTIYLDTNNNGHLDSFELSAVTDSQGNYKFAVPFGTYVVREVVPTGFRIASPATYAITLAQGQSSLLNNFGDEH